MCVVCTYITTLFSKYLFILKEISNFLKYWIIHRDKGFEEDNIEYSNEFKKILIRFLLETNVIKYTQCIGKV